MSLAHIVAEHNATASYFREPQWSVTDIDQTMADAMFSRLDSNLSPEFLFADGERPRAKAMKLKKIYETAIKELIKKGFQPTVAMYNF